MSASDIPVTLWQSTFKAYNLASDPSTAASSNLKSAKPEKKMLNPAADFSLHDLMLYSAAEREAEPCKFLEGQEHKSSFPKEGKVK